MAETRTLTAHPMHLDFWSHHLLAFAAAFLLAYVTRYIGLPVDASVRIAAIGEIGVLIAVGVPLYTMIVGRMIAARSRQMTLLQSALLGCVIASCLAAALGPSIGWLLGFGIGPFDEAMSRRDYWAALLMAYPASLLLHLTLGTGLWMILCFPWWKREYGDNSEQDLPPAAEVSPVRDANIAPLPSIMHRLPSEVRGTPLRPFCRAALCPHLHVERRASAADASGRRRRPCPPGPRGTASTARTGSAAQASPPSMQRRGEWRSGCRTA